MSRLTDLLREGGTELAGQADATGQLLFGLAKQPVAGLTGLSRGAASLATGRGWDQSAKDAADQVERVNAWGGGPVTERGAQRLGELGQTVKGVGEAVSKVPGVQQAQQGWDEYAQANPAVAAIMAGITEAAPGPGKAKAGLRAVEQAGYLPHTPLAPHPDVGTRYHRVPVGEMAEKTPLKIEAMKDANIVAMPWDMSSRHDLITSISGNELPTPTLTTGGQDYARDAANRAAGIGGASNMSIAKRIRDRNITASREGLEAGGSGKVYMMPSTMGQDAEFFSTMPSDALLQLVTHADLNKKQIAELDAMIRNAPLQATGGGLVRPFGDFVGLSHPEVQQQLLRGFPGATPGNLRTALAQQLTKVGPQKMLNFNKGDLMGAITDDALKGVPKGHMGNTVIEALGDTALTPSTHPAYDTDFAGRYAGTLGHNVPVEAMMPKTYARLLREMEGKTGDTRNMAIGAMEKRGSGFSEKVDQQTIDSVNKWIEEAQRAQQVGSY